MCRTCRVNHRTSTCGVDNPDLFFCVNCQTNDHAAWSRDCPTFIKKAEANRNQQEDAHYIYFPADDLLMWDTYPGQKNHGRKPTRTKATGPSPKLPSNNNKIIPCKDGRNLKNTLKQTANRKPAITPT
jgi:hypothetical protein